jgi:hypothetical protein
MNKIVFTSKLIVVFATALSLSAGARDRAVTDATSTSTSATGTTTTASGVATTPATGTTAPILTNDGYRQAALNASSGQKSASSIGQMIGPALIGAGVAVLWATCNPKCSEYGFALIGGGALALIAGSHNSGKGAQSDNLANQLSTNATATGTPTPNADGTTSTTLDPAAEKAIADAKKAGVTLDLNHGTMTLPNGSTVNLAALQTPEQLAAAVGGLSPSDMAKLKENLKKGAGKNAEAAGGGGGGSDVTVAGGGGHGGGSDETGGSGGHTGDGKAQLGINRNPAQVAGACKRLSDGSCMGVAGESIFTMIDRRVDVVCKRGELMATCPQ